MAKLQSVALLACMVVLLCVHAGDAITCSEVQNDLMPCISIFMGGASGVTPSCCDGVRNLKNAAATADDRRTACQCLKSAAGSIPAGADVGTAAKNLLRQCNVKLPYRISVSTNCDNSRAIRLTLPCKLGINVFVIIDALLKCATLGKSKDKSMKGVGRLSFAASLLAVVESLLPSFTSHIGPPNCM
nr:non-specific lipid-transfer protein 1-like [Ipomoea trifida]